MRWWFLRRLSYCWPSATLESKFLMYIGKNSFLSHQYGSHLYWFSPCLKILNGILHFALCHNIFFSGCLHQVHHITHRSDGVWALHRPAPPAADRNPHIISRMGPHGCHPPGLGRGAPGPRGAAGSAREHRHWWCKLT